MKKFIQIAAASAFALTMAAPAIAASSALDTTTYWEDNAEQVQPGVYKLMYDADNKAMRSDDDFAAMWDEATPEDQAAFKQACGEWEQDKAMFSDSVSARCKMATAP
jgi:hypothetical protein